MNRTILVTLCLSLSTLCNTTVTRAADAVLDQATKTVTLGVSGSVIRLQPWAEGALRVTAAPGKNIPETKSLAVIAAANSTGWEISEDANSVQLQSKQLRAVLNKQSGLLSCYKQDGTLLFEQKSWTLTAAKDAARDGITPGAIFSRANAERYYGAGVVGDQLRSSQAEVRLVNNNTDIHIPVLYSSRGYGLFWDNPSRGKIKLSPDTLTWEFSAGDAADFYVLSGTNADAAVGAYRMLTGNAPLMPKWAYGFWFSKNKFNSQKEVLDAAKNFRDRGYPVDLIIQDYFYWKPDGSPNSFDGWGSHQFVANRYPDPKGMIDQLHNEYHLKFMTVIWPRFDISTEHAKELIAANAMLPKQPGDGEWDRGTRFYDPFGEKGRSIYGRQVMDSLWPLGVDAWWMDAAEPEIPNQILAGFDTNGGPASRIMDAYPLLHTQGVYEAQRKADTQNQKRVVLLPRSAWAGMQRNAAVNWTGDIHQDWKTLAWQIEGLQNYSIAGLSYITTDVGGYGPTPEADRELFVRWFEWGTFCPIFRVHGVARPFPWEYGKPAEPVLKEFINLRYRLLPYIYSEAARVEDQQSTLMRPLVMDFANDGKALTTWDEFMFGPSLLVCPVYQSNYAPAATLEQWADANGKKGWLNVSYIKKGDEPAVSKQLIDGFSFKEGPNREQSQSDKVVVAGSFTPKENGKLYFVVSEAHAEGYPVKMTIDGKSVDSEPLNGDWEFPRFPFQAQAGVPLKFSYESKMKYPFLRVVSESKAGETREVYLPGKEDWYDFWTGEKIPGGKTLTAKTPLTMIPLYLRAGSIVPFGPEVQYADEKPADPIELRVYRGANGEFTLYEDEGDNYNHEKGAFSEIPIRWDEASRTLTIGTRKGEFPGMLKKRTFNVVFVGVNHGIGEQVTDKPDTQISYDGLSVSVKAP